MNMNQLAKLVCSLEGKKKSVNIAQVKEILSIISYLIFYRPQVLITLLKNGSKKKRIKGSA